MIRKLAWVNNPMLTRLLLPVLLEQCLAVLIGTVSIMLVSSVGGGAVSGVSLVDQLNNMFIAVFNAIATGATVVAAHKIGAGQQKEAGKVANQTLVVVTGTAFILGIITLIGGSTFLQFLYGKADPEVLSTGSLYIKFSALSYPFVGLYAACAGITRASGNTKSPLLSSILANVINISLASVLILVFDFGVLGAAIAMLCARVSLGLSSLILLRKGSAGFVMPKFSLKLERAVMAPVMDVGIPSGVDQLILQGVRLILASFLSGMGTAALHANTIASSINNLILIFGMSVSIVTTTIIGQAYGAKDYASIRRTGLQLNFISVTLQAVVSLVLLLFFRPLASLYGPSAETLAITFNVFKYNIVAQTVLWTGAFVMAQILRAIGEARYTMKVALFALLGFRLTLAWFLGLYLNWGVQGIWFSMYADWLVRSLFFIPRFFRKRWDTPERTGTLPLHN